MTDYSGLTQISSHENSLDDFAGNLNTQNLMHEVAMKVIERVRQLFHFLIKQRNISIEFLNLWILLSSRTLNIEELSLIDGYHWYFIISNSWNIIKPCIQSFQIAIRTDLYLDSVDYVILHYQSGLKMCVYVSVTCHFMIETH